MIDQHPEYGCPVSAALSVIGGKWKLPIVHLLSLETYRFNTLLRSIPGVTRQMLTTHLRELERDGVVHRRVYAEVPPRVEYSLTPFGHSLEPLLDQLRMWGKHYIEQQERKEDRGA
ncbi:MAG: helix-turn-helix transcriptional regulator [Blastochloris sp.]|nr:helix-turn-helix transcriptional regulator [Blastochloris sp.]